MQMLTNQYEIIVFNDFILMICSLIFIAFVAGLIYQIIDFIPTFMRSLLRSIRNKSIQEIDPDSMDSKLDFDVFKSMTFRFNPFKKETK